MSEPLREPASSAPGSPPARREWGPFAVWAVWTLVTALPYLALAWGAAQRGRFFEGVLTFGDDMYQYLSFVEQASRGQLLFANKFDLRPFAPFAVQLQWLAVGWLAALLGGRILLAFHVAGALAGGLLAAAVTRVLRTAGLTGKDVSWGLGLVLVGSGLGWVRGLLGAPLQSTIDPYFLIYPANQRLSGGPHALLGTALLLFGLVELVRWRSGQSGAGRWLAIATILGLSRPYDMAVLVGTAALLFLLDLARGQPLRSVLSRAAATTWLLPTLLYDYLVFFLHPSFALYSGAQNTTPRPAPLEWVLALGPAALLSLWHLKPRATPAAFRPLREALGLGLLTILVALALPLSFGLQLVTAVGTLLLLLAATATPPRFLPLATLLLCPSTLWLFATLSSVDPDKLWAPEAAWTLQELERSCEPGDLLLAPEGMSLFAAGLTPCRVVFGHWVLTPDYRSRRAEAAAFYSANATPALAARTLFRLQPDLVLARAGSLRDIPGYRVAWRREPLELWRRVPHDVHGR